MNPVVGKDNWFFTTYFNQVVHKPAKPHPLPKNWDIFVSIASWKDIQLIMTLKTLIRLAAHPERLHIVILNQYDFEDEEQLKMAEEVRAYINEVKGTPGQPFIYMEELPLNKVKNQYHARYRLQQYYNGETYQL